MERHIHRELASQEMKNSAGATWDAATAGNAIGTWSAFGEQIDVVVSNNDGMGMSMFNAWAKDNKVPTFGYDANSDAVAAIAEGYGGTISQHADVQAYLTLRVLRNALDGVDVDTGIGTADDAGNCLTEGEDYRYSEEDRSYYALNVAVTADNYKDFTDSTKVYDKVSKQLDSSKSPSKKVWLDIYNASDNFLSSTYQPLLENYDDLLNLTVDYIGGDGRQSLTSQTVLEIQASTMHLQLTWLKQTMHHLIHDFLNNKRLITSKLMKQRGVSEMIPFFR